MYIEVDVLYYSDRQMFTKRKQKAFVEHDKKNPYDFVMHLFEMSQLSCSGCN